ncbi:ABC-type multidrug transport system, ATPase component [Longilinea arvoryzae]|uniref:ABC-type multidrug transport system, ATPase component n=1 Tax=Longilinea arvoryzae TaxID=360412 RepID=A0A0S7BDZ4_9CHLR|nr:ABC transporter ATP-binding protein [Longilinea arvoryzae]GAP12707.1 ABC-type multidrug transport system, ATPase component [Longilinea arvoryzae]
MKLHNEAVIEVENLIKHYPGVRAVDGVSFDIHRGEIFGMLGPNGAGKTTTIECIEGLRQPEQGNIRVLGLDPHQDGYALRERIGIQFQSAALPDRIKVWEALDLFSSFYQKTIDWRLLLAKMELEEKRNAYISKLSGGQKQRVFIALALVNDPEIVFLDELTTGLDPQARRAMWDLVWHIQSIGKTVFLTTHFMEEAERLCDRVAIIDHGKIVALDSPQKLVDSLGDESRVVFETSQPVDHAIFTSLPGVTRVEKIGERILVYGKKEGLVGKVVNALDTANLPYDNIHSEQPTLEDVFLRLTGKEIRD